MPENATSTGSENPEEVGRNAVFASQVELSKASPRKFFYVPATAIDRQRPQQDAKIVKGTMKIPFIPSTATAYEVEAIHDFLPAPELYL